MLSTGGNIILPPCLASGVKVIKKGRRPHVFLNTVYNIMKLTTSITTVATRRLIFQQPQNVRAQYSVDIYPSIDYSSIYTLEDGNNQI